MLPDARITADATCAVASCSAIPRLVDRRAPASLWSVRFEGGTMKLPADPAMDWYGIVLRGSLDVEGCGALGPWQAYRVVGGGVALKGLADVVLGVAADAALGEPLTAVAGKVGRCERVDLNALPDIRFADGQAHARLAFRTGKAYFGLLYSDPEVGAPLHTHENAWEVVHVLRGSGEVTAADEIGPLMGGSSYAFAPKSRHGYKSEGGAPTVAVQMYSPPGPEQRFFGPAAER
jgi:mannose-6-phosphate isomerase-like protein (cupin superfamily)